MNREEVLKVAEKFGFWGTRTNVFGISDKIESFAAAMYVAGAADMKERAAKECERVAKDGKHGPFSLPYNCAAFIRALPIAAEQAPCDQTGSSVSYDLSTNTEGEQG